MLHLPGETVVANEPVAVQKPVAAKVNHEIDQLRRDILCKFEASSYRQLRRVDVTVGDVGAVELRGEMESYYLRQMAYQTAIETPGVDTVTDRITVRSC
ncbi:BON domain-containing protein [Novipirellula rosea]|uniref:BON domain-containing protein n=1 Tax=Novipirellula rosea TaxID=1031540 RepID=A0ABP8NVA1_9BACT|tara:strand:+ start:5476 stop:5772 length:297 start_codon:yes stop_codon:yes gene_type:complete